MPLPTRPCLILAGVVLATCVTVGRSTPAKPSPVVAPTATSGPSSELIDTGSSYGYARSKWMEAKILELQARLDRLEDAS